MKNILFIGLLLLSMSACSSFLEEYSQDLARVENITDLDELLLGSAYLPAGKISSTSSGGSSMNGDPYSYFIHFMSDELQQNGSQVDRSAFDPMSSSIFGYYTWQRNVGIDIKGTMIGMENSFWKSTYQYINATNMILDELENVSAKGNEEELNKIRIEGEARFLRALYYFSLVNLYAEPYAPSKAAQTQGIPLKLTSYIEDKDYTCSRVSEIYEQIIRDLKKAEECLAQTSRKSVYRADLTATYLLMSRVYLYMQDYKNARTYAQYVLDRNDNLTDLKSFAGQDNVFTSQSSEVLFSMGGHLLSSYIYGSDSNEEQYPFYVSEDLIKAFDNDNDLRKSLYITEGTFGYYYKKIYWGRSHYNEACSVSDNFMFRTSEAYLNLAEAAAFDADEPTARRILGLLQAKRFSTPPAITESGNALIDLIRHERQRELCLEGHRWYDLRRYTVCEKYPWSKSFQHVFTDYELSLSVYDYVAIRTRVFELEANDKAYTLSFPKEVLDFQNNLSKNERPDRIPVETINH